MGNALLSFLGGMGTGYMAQAQQQKVDARLDRQEAQNAQLHTARMSELNDAQALRQKEKDYEAANQAAMSQGQETAGMQVTDDAGSAAFTKDADAAAMLGDMSAAKNEGTQTSSATRVSTGRTGATQGGITAGSQVFTDPVQAKEFAKTQQLSDYTKFSARQAVADQFGKGDVSDALRAKRDKLEAEGGFKALALLHSGDLEGAKAIYNATGNNRMPEGSNFVATEVVNPVTRLKDKVFSLVGKDGTVLVPNLDNAMRTYLSPETQYSMIKGDEDRQLNREKTDIAARAEATREKALELKDKQDERRFELMLHRIGGMNRGGAAGGAGGAGGASAQYNPYAGFDPKEAQSAATKRVDEAIAMGSAKESDRAKLIAQNVFTLQEAYRQNNDVGLAMSSVQKDMQKFGGTPAGYAGVYQNGLKLGLTPEQLKQRGYAPPPSAKVEAVANPFDSTKKQPTANAEMVQKSTYSGSVNQ